MSAVAEPRRLADVAWMAARLGRSRRTVYRLAKRRIVPAVWIAGRLYFDPEHVEAWIRAGGERSITREG